MKILNWFNNNIWLTIILLAGAALRFYHIDFQSVWLDEIHTMKEANPLLSLSDMYGEIMGHEQMPPLYFYTVHFLFKIFGYTPFIARLYSAIIGVFAIYAIYLLGKEMFDKRVGIIAAALVSVNYFQLYYSQEARPYVFLFLFSTLSFYYLIRYIKGPTMKNSSIYGTISALMLYSHFFGLFILAAQYVILFLFLLLAEDKKKFFIRSLVSGILTLILFIPAINILIGVSEITSFWIQLPMFDFYTDVFKFFFGKSELVLTMVGFLIIFYFINLAKEKDTPITYKAIIENKTIFSFVILAPWIVIVILIPLIRSYLMVPMLQNRYFAGLLPAVIILLAVAINQFNNKIIRIGFVSMFVVFSITDIVVVKKYYTTVNKSQWREVSQFLIDSNKENEPVVSSWGWHYSYFLDNGKVNMTVVDKSLEDYIDEMMRNPSMVKTFWYADAHSNRPYNYSLSESAQRFMDDNFIEDDNINLYEAWAKHFIRTSGALKTVDLSKYEPLKEENGAKIKFWVDSFEINNENLKAEGWARIEGQDAYESHIKIVLISDKNAYELPTQKVKRTDVTNPSESSFNFDNSGFLSKAKTGKLENGKYRLGIIIKDRKTNVEGLVLTDKSFDINR